MDGWASVASAAGCLVAADVEGFPGCFGVEGPIAAAVGGVEEDFDGFAVANSLGFSKDFEGHGAVDDEGGNDVAFKLEGDRFEAGLEVGFGEGGEDGEGFAGIHGRLAGVGGLARSNGFRRFGQGHSAGFSRVPAGVGLVLGGAKCDVKSLRMRGSPLNFSYN